SEYNTETSIEWLSYKLARWIQGDPAEIAKLRIPYTARLVVDRYGEQAVLFQSKWDADYVVREHPQIKFSAVSGPGFNAIEATAQSAFAW
ncbi:MAG TPA: hypothetical protein VL096_17355, partial [Pirellulaceae bacterium]|nr:hypothetical protein [Pirellulaceae bacterium]